MNDQQMKTFFCRQFIFALILLLAVLISPTLAQESTVYITILSTKLFVAGAANPPTGLFYQKPTDDTTWNYLGGKNSRAFGLAVHAPAAGQLIYIAAGNGVHRTTDDGKSWKITTGWEITEVLSVAIDPTNSATVYIATAYGIYKTSDGGATWKQMNNGLTATFSSGVIVDHRNSKVLYCATEDGVFGSDDGAENWHKLNLPVTNIRVVAQHPRDQQMLFAGTENDGIYISRDGGKAWAESNIGSDHRTFYTIVFNPNHPEIMYAGGYATGVYKSMNGGKSWQRYHEGLMNLNIHALAVDPANSSRVYAGTMGSGVFRSDDGGITWRQAGLSGAQVSAMSIQPF